MPEIRPEPEDVILQKLTKLKCSTNCQNNANYLMFGYGLYCAACLAQLKDVNQDQFVNFGNLAKIIINLVDDYDKSNKSQISHFKVAKTQAQKSKAELKKIRDSLSFDIKSVKTKANNTLDESYSACLKQFRTQPLQSLYQPDLTATSIINETSLLLSNLKILTVEQKQGVKHYKFKQSHKNPQQVFKQTKKKYKQLRECIQAADIQARDVMQNFRKQVKQFQN